MMPRIPREEYPQRWEKARQILKEQNLDLILAYSDDRFTYGNAYSRYFGDLQTVFEDTLVMLLPEELPVSRPVRLRSRLSVLEPAMPSTVRF